MFDYVVVDGGSAAAPLAASPLLHLPAFRSLLPDRSGVRLLSTRGEFGEGYMVKLARRED
jgi:hypothetical protein